MVDAFANIKAGLTDGMREEARNKPVDVTEKMVIVTGALCKLFVGDLVRDGKFYSLHISVSNLGS